MDNNFDEDIDELEALVARLLNDTSDKKQNDISTEKKDYDYSDMEFNNFLESIFGPIEVNPEYEEKLKIVSEMEKKYTQKFGDIISDDEEYSLMSEDEKIQTIQECLDTNKPRDIILGGDIPSDEDKNQCRFLKHMKIFY